MVVYRRFEYYMEEQSTVHCTCTDPVHVAGPNNGDQKGTKSSVHSYCAILLCQILCVSFHS